MYEQFCRIYGLVLGVYFEWDAFQLLSLELFNDY